MLESRWTMRVTATREDAAHVVVRKHRFAVGRPVHFDPEYGQVTALEYALGALGGEIVNGLREAARRRRIAIDAVEAVVDGELANTLAYLEVVGAEGRPAVSRVAVKVFVASAHDEATVKSLWNETRDRLPLVRLFGAAASLNIDLRFAAG